MQPQTLSEWLQRIEQQHGQGIDLGLTRIARVAGRLGLDLTPPATVVTVAGTNGKGSFVSALSALLAAHGLSVACYTSPHLERFNERIVINGTEADDSSIVEAFRLVEAARQSEQLTYFEFTTLAALLLLTRAPVDVLLLEIGLGGRLDAVNIIEPDMAVITSIDLDHQDWLGDNRTQIAAEKAGILREKTPLYCAVADLLHMLPQVDNGRELVIKGRDFNVDYDGRRWLLQGAAAQIMNEPLADNGLSPDSQALALLVAARLLPALDSGLAWTTLERLVLPGRFQHFTGHNGVTVIADVAHNVQAARLLHSRLQALPPQGRRVAVMHLLADKDADGIAAILAADFDGWFVGGLDHPRATDCTTLAETVSRHSKAPVSISKNMRQALARALSSCRAGDQIVVFGSFFVVAELLPGLKRI